jgi:archaellum component FlaC
MTQVADAPWVREAEMYGMPPYEDNSAFEETTEQQGKELAKADKLTDQIVDLLLNAEDALLKFEDEYDTAVSLNKEIREMMVRVEELGCDLRSLAMKVERGVKA